MLQLFGLLALLATLRVSDAGRASDTAARGTPVEPCEQHGIPSAWTKPHGRPHISGALAGTADTQRALWAHQHPADCSRAQFFVATTWWGGIGGKLNQAASALGRAIAQGRVFLFDFDVEYNEFARGPPGSFCPNEGTLDTCFFVGLSNCTLVDVYGSEFVALAGSRQLSDGELEMKRSEVSQAAGGRILFEKVMDTRQWHDAAPPSIQPLMERALGKDAPRLALAWWRAQAVAYMVRPNAQLLAELAARRQRFFAGQRIAPGTVAVHVRHGDKGKEAALVPDEAHLAAALFAIAKGGASLSKRSIFVSTEDPATIGFFSAGRRTANLSVHVQYTTVPRDNHGGGGAPNEVPDAVEEFLNAFLNLDLALEADALVCWAASRWCDLMRRLMATSACKAHALLVDPSQHQHQQQQQASSHAAAAKVGGAAANGAQGD